MNRARSVPSGAQTQGPNACVTAFVTLTKYGLSVIGGTSRHEAGRWHRAKWTGVDAIVPVNHVSIDLTGKTLCEFNH